MTVYSWTVLINKIPYGVTCRDPWTAVSRALQKWRKEHPKSTMLAFDIFLLNRTKVDQKSFSTEQILKEQEAIQPSSLSFDQASDLPNKHQSDTFISFSCRKCGGATSAKANSARANAKLCAACYLEESLHKQDDKGK